LLWFAFCSLLVTGLVLVFSLAPLSSAMRAASLLLVVIVLLCGAVWQPDLLRAAAFGSEPGAVALAAVFVTRRLAQWQYRRRVEFLPGFQRLQKPVLSNGGPHWRQHQPSTIDHPRAQGTSG
jgi:hypothetical protein